MGIKLVNYDWHDMVYHWYPGSIAFASSQNSRLSPAQLLHFRISDHVLNFITVA